MPTALVMVEPGTGRILFANENAEAVSLSYPNDLDKLSSGYYATDTAGKVIPRDLMPRYRVARGEALSGFEMTWHTPERSVPLLVYSAMLPAMWGRPAVGLISFHDILKLKASEAERGRLLEEL